MQFKDLAYKKMEEFKKYKTFLEKINDNEI